MSRGSSHPVAQLVLDALDDDDLVVRALVERPDEAVAVVVENEIVRRTVIVEKRDDRWVMPTLLGGSTPSKNGQRPQTTTAMRPFFDHHLSQSGWPVPNGSRPSVAWQAVTGFAAEDAELVIVSTGHDGHEAEAGTDGFFVTLARAAWNAEPDVQVRKTSGNLVDVQL